MMIKRCLTSSSSAPSWPAPISRHPTFPPNASRRCAMPSWPPWRIRSSSRRPRNSSSPSTRRRARKCSASCARPMRCPTASSPRSARRWRIERLSMPEYQLYCFAQSGNAYRAALMLNLIGADWQPIYVDFFGKGEQRTPEYRTNVNEMGEVPVLVHGKNKFSQSGVILTYLSEHFGKFRPQTEDERLEALRWILFDNQ